MKRAAVILGAGASYDVANGTTPTNPSMRPPLAREPFEQRFWDLRSLYPGAIVLGSELGRLASRQDEPFDLEAKLAEYAESKDLRTREAFKQIPAYLRDVILATTETSPYTPSPSNYINLVRWLLQDETHEVMFISLNYDAWLEKALRTYDPTLGMNNMLDYIDLSRPARVVKVHGSLNWGVPMDNMSGFLAQLPAFDPMTQPDQSIEIANSTERTLNWRGREGRNLYPRLTAPIRGKTFSCPEAHTQALADFLADCHKFMFIGTSGLDEDLLSFINQYHVGPGLAYYVNAGSATTHLEERCRTAIRGFRHPNADMRMLWDKGFVSFMDNRELVESFLAAD